MALPSGVNGKTLTFGTTTGFDGIPVPDGSRVTITTSKNVKHITSGRQLVAGQIVRKFVSGIATFDELVPNDAPGLDRYDWTYSARFEIAGAAQSPESFSFVLFDDDPQTIDGDLLSPVPSSIGTPVSVNALRLPPGGMVGQALVFTADFGVAWASLQPAGDYATHGDVSTATAAVTVATAASLATKVNSSTYTAGLAGKQDVATLDAATAAVVAAGGSATAAAVAADATVRVAFGSGSTAWLQAVAAGFDFAFTSITTADAATGLPTAAAVRWPDGTTGTFTGTTDGSNGYTGYAVTWGGSTTKTVTASGITYDSTTGLALGPTTLAVA